MRETPEETARRYVDGWEHDSFGSLRDMLITLIYAERSYAETRVAKARNEFAARIRARLSKPAAHAFNIAFAGVLNADDLHRSLGLTEEEKASAPLPLSAREIELRSLGTGKLTIDPATLPNAHEREVLAILTEELAEVTQRITKLLRFGRDQVQKGQPLTNAERLSMEFGDLLEISHRATAIGLLVEAYIEKGIEAKKQQLAKYMQTSAEDAQP